MTETELLYGLERGACVLCTNGEERFQTLRYLYNKGYPAFGPATREMIHGKFKNGYPDYLRVGFASNTKNITCFRLGGYVPANGLRNDRILIGFNSISHIVGHNGRNNLVAPSESDLNALLSNI